MAVEIVSDSQVQENEQPNEGLFSDLESREINYYNILSAQQNEQPTNQVNPETGEVQTQQAPQQEPVQQLSPEEILQQAHQPDQKNVPQIDPSIMKDAQLARKILDNPDLVDHIRNFFDKGNNANQPQHTPLPEPPQAPAKPMNYDPQDAISDPNSESAKYIKAFQRYQHDTQEYYTNTLKIQAENAEKERQFYREREEKREQAFKRQAEERNQFALQQESQAREIANLRTKHGMSDAEIVEFVQFVKNPEVLNNTDNWVTVFRNARAAQKGIVNPTDLAGQPMSPVMANGQATRNTFQGTLQDRYPRSPTHAGGRTETARPKSVLDNLFSGLQDMSDRQTRPFLTKTE